MRRIMVVLSLIAIAVVAIAPAIAQEFVPQEFEQEDIESGGVAPSVEFSNAGDNVNFCGTVLQSANSGNVINEQGVAQYSSFPDDLEFGGSSIVIAPEAAGECVQTIEQAAAAAA